MMSPRVMESERREIPYRRRAVKSALFFVHENILSYIADHADVGYLDEKEVMGLLIGNLLRDDDGEYAVVTKVVTSELIADRVSVKFDQNSMEALFDAVDEMEFDEQIVGWYHSHLGYGCYMSEKDIKTQDTIFGGETGFALVIDPVLQEISVFDSKKGAPEKVTMIVIESD